MAFACLGLAAGCGGGEAAQPDGGGAGASLGAASGAGGGDGMSVVDAGGGGIAAAGGAGASGFAAMATALGAVMPRVVKLNAVGSTLTSPRIVPITYSNDTNRASIESFLTQFAASQSWTTLTSEYGIGRLTVGTPIHLTASAPAAIDDAAIQAMLLDNLSGPTPAWGPADTSTIYALFFPTNSVVDDGTGDKSCQVFDGYHSDTMVGSAAIAYAVVASCPGIDGRDISNVNQITIAASHETVEAATDPLPDFDPGYVQTDDAHLVWSFVNDGELADMCEFADTAFWSPSDLDFMIQRMWSNAAAAAGHDPCVGDPTEPYYQTVPDQSTPVTASFFGVSTATHGVQIALNATAKVSLKVYADAAAGPFNVTVQDWSSDWNGGPRLLQITTPTATVEPGDTLQTSITVKASDPNIGNGEVFVVVTTPTGAGPSTFYFGLVTQ